MKRIDLYTILRIDSKIAHRSTGSPNEFARDIGMSRSTLFEYLAYMRHDFGLIIEYDRYKRTYYYDGYSLLEAFYKNDLI